MPNEKSKAAARLRTKERESGAAVASPVTIEGDGGARGATGGDGFYLYGVIRSGGWRTLRRSEPVEELTRIRFRDLEALADPVRFEVPGLSDAALQQHQRTVDLLMRAGTVLPLPFGVVFRDRRALIGFLQDQYLVLDEGLGFLEGHWELRLHLLVAEGERTPELSDMATHIYSELRRNARAALPFRRQEGGLFGAAFLVERESWIRFVEKADDLVHSHPDLAFDVTGPWPAYDFVRLIQ